MTNREKFNIVFGKNIHWSNSIEPHMLALKSAHIDGVDCMEEWLNAEYQAPAQELVLDKISAEVEQLPITDTAVRLVTEIIDKYKANEEKI